MRNIRLILAEAVLTRALLFLIGLFAGSWIPFQDSYYQNNFHYHDDSIRGLDMWARWDSEWYLYIAEKGYSTEGFPSHYQDATAGFFPLYPLLIRVLSAVLGSSIVAGLVISNGSLLLFLLILVQLGKENGIDQADQERAAWYFLIFPTTFFLSAVYSESLFLVLSAGAFLMAHRKRWWIAGLLGCLASLCRPVGVVLIVPLTYMRFKEAGFSLKNLRIDALSLLLIPLGTAAFSWYCQWSFNDPLAFVARQNLWRQGGGAPWKAFVQFFDMKPAFLGFHNSWNDFAIAILALVALPFVFLRFGIPYGLYACGLVLIPLCSSLMSFQRLILASFPHFLLLGTLGGKHLANWAISLVCIAFMVLYFAIFSQWGWIG